jgi:DNA repair photolyase
VQLKETRKSPKQLLNKASGFLEGYSHTLNPYTGCAFACSYCYVRQMPVALFREGEWGGWVDIKENAAALLENELAKAKRKGPVTRDMDLLARLGERVRVSMTVETDREDIRRAFTPSAPPIPARLKALSELAARGIPVQATIAPVLPCSEQYAEQLSGIVDRVCIDDYFMGDGSKGKRTERIGVRSIYEALGLDDWYSRDAYERVREQLLQHFQQERVFVSKQGFLP